MVELYSLTYTSLELCFTKRWFCRLCESVSKTKRAKQVQLVTDTHPGFPFIVQESKHFNMLVFHVKFKLLLFIQSDHFYM